MPEHPPHFLKKVMKQTVQALLKVNKLRFAVLFITVAVVVSVVIVLNIDFLWDRRFNAELEFAGVVTPFLDALFLVIFLNAMFDEIREEVARREKAESAARKLNDELEARVEERTRQLLSAQEELLRREKLVLLSQVADNVGHELRNPLGVINNAAYFLQAVSSDADETTKEYLGIIKDETANAERIVSDLLDAVRSKPPHPEEVDVAEVIQQTLRKCDIPDSIIVKLDIPAVLPAVHADPMHLHQVFWNLITNAKEAMAEGGGTLEIGIAVEARALRISFRDNGCGMTPEQQARLFQPLFTTKVRRVGLGLVVVKNLTQANGGRVEAVSEAGKGSVFTITLPCAR